MHPSTKARPPGIVLNHRECVRMSVRKEPGFRFCTDMLDVAMAEYVVLECLPSGGVRVQRGSWLPNLSPLAPSDDDAKP